MTYKSFREQHLECIKNGNLIEEEHCFKCGHKLLICKKYDGQCRSSKCREERTRENFWEKVAKYYNHHPHWF